MRLAKADELPDVMNITYETGGDIIRRIRLLQKMSMEDFAREWELSDKTLLSWENNRVSARFEFVMDVLQEYGYEVHIVRKVKDNEKVRNRVKD